ncbi:MAG: hypothetical protein ACNA76_09375 [Anaerosomatales bacterium]
MAGTRTAHTIWSYTEGLARDARAKDGLPEQLVQRARESTVRNLSHIGEGSLDSASRYRVRSYFRSVIRRLAARSNAPGAREYRLSAMAASVAADLAASGADGERVAREVSAWLEAQQGAA